MHRTAFVAATLLLVSGRLAGQQAPVHDPDQAVAGGGVFPSGWNVRTERNAPRGW